MKPVNQIINFYKTHYDFFSYNVFGYLSRFLVIVSGFLIIRIYSIEQFGIYSLYVSYSVLITKISGFAFEKVNIINSSKDKNQNEIVFSNIFISKGFLTLLKFIFIALAINIFENKLLFIIIFCTYELQTYYVLYSSIFDIRSTFRFKTLLNFLFNFVIFIILIAQPYLSSSPKILDFVIIVLSVKIIFYFVQKTFLNVKIKFGSFDLEILKTVLKDGSNLLIITIFIAIYFKIDMVMLDYFNITKYEIGLYAAIYKIFEGVGFISTQFRVYYFPKFTKLNREKSKIFKDLQKLLLIQVFMALILIGTILSLKGFIFTVILKFSSADMSKITYLFEIITCTIIFSFQNDSLLAFLLGNKKYKYAQFPIIFTGLFNIIANYFLIPSLNILGAGITTFFSEFLLTLLMYSFIIKIYKSKLVLN